MRFLLLWVGVPLVVAGVIIALLARRRTASTLLSRLETWTIGLVASGAALVALAGILLAFLGTAVFQAEPLTVRGFDLVNAETPAFAQKADAVVDAKYESVQLTVTGLPLAARWLLYAETALPVLAMIAISGAVFWLSFLLLRGRPFVRSLTWTIGASAVIVMVCGLGTQIFASAARGAVVEFLDPRIITGGGTFDNPQYEGTTGWSLSLDLAPVGWAIGLALVAAAFELAQRLQKDTEGLV
ncbi:MAG: hypothetical protein WA971_01285 [Microbacterium sp.]